MMAEFICYAVLYLAIIAWLYFDALFCRKASGFQPGFSFVIAYCLLFGVTRVDNVVVNGTAFFFPVSSVPAGFCGF